ncbi:MAG TPA: Flp pilus assembly protein CpaB [Terracidiphilus sp.]|nr:Flp pilus assembly protein CpaB [Terracidiphilus sp.]
MNRRLLIILLSAFVVAAVCTFVVVRMVGSRMSASKPVASTSLVAAAKDIPLGTVLAAADLTQIQIVGQAPQGSILDPKNAIGRGVISPIYAGEPILNSRLAPVGSSGGLAATIPQGMRAIAIKVDQVIGLAGFVTPGMRVDVLISGVPPTGGGSSSQTQAHTILQNIDVLSAGTDIQRDSAGKPQQVQVVNLLVTPEQAQVMTLASDQHIQLVLRNPLDTKVSPVPGTEMASLFAGSGQPNKPAHIVRKAAAKPPAFTIQVYNGAQRTEEKFASPGGKQ